MVFPSKKLVDSGSLPDLPLNSTAILIQGIGAKASEDVERITSALLPLPPEGDSTNLIGLLIDWGSDEETKIKLQAYAGYMPNDWPAPSLAIYLVDEATLPNQAMLKHEFTSHGYDDTLHIVLCKSDSDRDSLYQTLKAIDQAQIGIFSTRDSDHSGYVWMVWGLITSLYNNMICLDFADIRDTLPGKGIAYWSEGKTIDESVVNLPYNVTGAVYGRIGGSDISMEDWIEGVEFYEKQFDDDICIVASCIIEPDRERAHGSFLFCTTDPWSKRSDD